MGNDNNNMSSPYQLRSSSKVSTPMIKSKSNKDEDGPVGKKKYQSRSARAGITFPIGRISRYLKYGRYAKRTSGAAAIYMTAVLEFMVAEVLELSAEAARQNKKKVIRPRHILLAVQNDEDLSEYFGSTIVPSGGVVPHIEPVLLPRKKSKKAKH